MVKVTKYQQLLGYNAKLLDINESDTAAHTVATGLAPNTVAILIEAVLQSGSGTLQVYPNEGTSVFTLSGTEPHLVYITNNRLKYAQNTANDDFDVYCFGYIVEGERKQ